MQQHRDPRITRRRLLRDAAALGATVAIGGSVAGDITLGKPGVPLHLSIKVETTGHVSHTGQILFPDPITTQVYALTPYSAETVPRTYNSQDRVYAQQGGARSMLTLHRLGSSLGAGFAGAITLVVDPGATPVKVGA